jgi:hypothetical protein
MTHTVRLAAVVLLSIVSSVASAQERPSSDSIPRAGEWAAEVVVGSANGGSLLRFWSRESALLVGAEFYVIHYDESSGNSGFIGTSSNVGARLGVRRYRRSSTPDLRPLVGLGVRGGVGRAPNDTDSWSAGGYGELGAVYFVTPHFSVGGVGELQVNYSKQTQDAGVVGKFDATKTELTGSLVRLVLSVYF